MFQLFFATQGGLTECIQRVEISRCSMTRSQLILIVKSCTPRGPRLGFWKNYLKNGLRGTSPDQPVHDTRLAHKRDK
jgi:hypothetical protein